MNVYELINRVSAELAKEGIAKDRKNTIQDYAFRGIDDIYASLAPKLAASGLVILPRVLSRQTVEKTTNRGGALFYTVIEVEFDLVSAKDGSKHTIRVCGEAMDSGDKSTNKAMSAAYKYACLQTFCIPTVGDNDADATTHEVSANLSPEQIAEIKSLIEETKSDETALLAWAKADSVETIPFARFDQLIAALRKKLK